MAFGAAGGVDGTYGDRECPVTRAGDNPPRTAGDS